MDEREMTLGEKRVRVSFNPSANALVDQIKQDTAALIDRCAKLTATNAHERNRCVALAQTAYEEAAMWAVKAATSQ